MRWSSGRASAATAALLALILASCASTSDGNDLFGFSPGVASGSAESTRPAVPATGSASAQAGVFEFDDDDPILPNTMAILPNGRPGTETAEAIAAGEGETEQPRQAAAASPVHEEADPASKGDPDIVQADSQTPEQPAGAATVASARDNEDTSSRGFLSAFFSPSSAQAATKPASQRQQPAAQGQPRPLVALAAASPAPSAPASTSNRILGGDALPGVRTDSLYQITRRSGLDDDSDVDLYEMPGSYQVASAAGMARLAPNGLLTQTNRVDVNCLQPALVRKLNAIERRFDRRVVVTSGFRNPSQNARARGARNSLHMYCAAADIQVPGVDKWTLAEFVRSMPGRGGVGTYCHTESVHVDIGPERDWNWRCRRRN